MKMRPCRQSTRVRHAIARRAAIERRCPELPSGKLAGTQQARLVRDEIENLLAIPDVIAAGENFDAGGQQFLDEPRRDAETRGGVFAVGDHQVQLLARDQIRDALDDDAPSRRAYDVSDEKNAHELMLAREVQRAKRQSAEKKMERSTSPCGARS